MSAKTEIPAELACLDTALLPLLRPLRNKSMVRGPSRLATATREYQEPMYPHSPPAHQEQLQHHQPPAFQMSARQNQQPQPPLPALKPMAPPLVTAHMTLATRSQHGFQQPATQKLYPLPLQFNPEGYYQQEHYPLPQHQHPSTPHCKLHSSGGRPEEWQIPRGPHGANDEDGKIFYVRKAYDGQNAAPQEQIKLRQQGQQTSLRNQPPPKKS
ncbi:hypothetical protein PCANC_28704 [Puccinia coronata f. sp. avenae]|uniref:Uncharacterized protein n=1 Tax=Puccinia coronata f. sp. avenae TaxID=200324 RepID=A0A2N5S1A2_9BASI|nr:hypothetical protein PCANC_28704 [Puccinia coronata f. sp. avenae]